MGLHCFHLRRSDTTSESFADLRRYMVKSQGIHGDLRVRHEFCSWKQRGESDGTPLRRNVSLLLQNGHLLLTTMICRPMHDYQCRIISNLRRSAAVFVEEHMVVAIDVGQWHVILECSKVSIYGLQKQNCILFSLMQPLASSTVMCFKLWSLRRVERL